MITMKRILTAIIVVFSIHPACGWWSETIEDPLGDNHERLSKDTLGAITSVCPDMGASFYYGDIWAATEGSADDTYAHGGNPANNDGPAMGWWTNALYEYKYFNFGGTYGAYWFLGSMVHLVEDMGVPAHAMNVPHAFPALDNLESNSARNYTSSSAMLYYNASNYPSDYKDFLKDYTQDIINNDSEVSPPAGNSWNDFWAAGSYGPNGDMFHSTALDATAEENALVAHQLASARNYTSGALLAASKKLPPLVRTQLLLSAPVINTETGNNISFKIIENRTAAVKISLVVAETGQFVKDSSGKIWNQSEEILGADSELPFGKIFNNII